MGFSSLRLNLQANMHMHMPSPQRLLLLEDSDSLAIHFSHLFSDFKNDSKKRERLALANSRPPSAPINSGCFAVISCPKLFSTQRKQRVVKTLLRTSPWKQKLREGPEGWTGIPLHLLLCSHILRLRPRHQLWQGASHRAWEFPVSRYKCVSLIPFPQTELVTMFPCFLWRKERFPWIQYALSMPQASVRPWDSERSTLHSKKSQKGWRNDYMVNV